MSSGTDDTTITITLPSAFVAKVREVGLKKGCSDSGVLRDALTVYLENWAWYDVLLRNMENADHPDPDEVERLIDEYRDEVESGQHQPD